ncbi:hypothetical protein AVEN_179921-1 [Araneus ventricosus]|uniref:Tc1-like transposase DDE domain-containing protein n=1 Tax=Araneus ventricosus TaxID=182803 RepID=A0A4Y2K780_ARAVE|nr:hypothetical protein AVEN_179921-1 [Araneus ventricosus]
MTRVTCQLETTLFKLSHHTTGRAIDPNRFSLHQARLHGGSSLEPGFGPRPSVPEALPRGQCDPENRMKQQVIGYGGCVEWPPRSPDLNPMDFFLWGYIKQRVYATPPPTLQELRNRITDACASVSPAMLYNAQREAQSRVQMCIVAEGHHFEHAR